MSHHIAVSGLATPTGLYARCGDGWRKLEPTRTPIVAQLTPLGAEVREACTAILAGEVKACPWCDSIAPCDCLRWMEYLAMQDADPHGDLSQFSDDEIPY